MRGVITWLQEDHRMLRRNIEPLPARLACHRVVHADHVIAKLREQRAVALVGPWRDPIFPRPHDPAHLIFVHALASRAGQPIGAGFVLIVEEIAFVKSHGRIISGRDGQDGGIGRTTLQPFLPSCPSCPSSPCLPSSFQNLTVAPKRTIRGARIRDGRPTVDPIVSFCSST